MQVTHGHGQQGVKAWAGGGRAGRGQWGKGDACKTFNKKELKTIDALGRPGAIPGVALDPRGRHWAARGWAERALDGGGRFKLFFSDLSSVM